MDHKATERMLADAFKRAAKSRSEAGLPQRQAEIRRTRDGQRWVGPSSYRITLWLRPWEYVAALDEMRRVGHPGSLNSYLQSLFRPAMAHRSRKKGTA